MVKPTIEMPEEALSALREAPGRFIAELRFAAAVPWYHQGRIGGSKAAQVAGMTRLEVLDELARRKLDVVKVDLDQHREEIAGALVGCGQRVADGAGRAVLAHALVRGLGKHLERAGRSG